MKASKKIFSWLLVFTFLFGAFSFSVNASAKEDNTLSNGVITDHDEINKILDNMKRSRSTQTIKLKFKNKQSGKCLDVDHLGGCGTNVIQCAYNGGNNQLWQLKSDPSSDGFYLSPLHDLSLNLDVSGGVNANGTPIVVYHIAESSSRWKLEYFADKGGWRLFTSCSGYQKCIAVERASLLDGARVIQWVPSTTDTNDIWQMQIVV